MTSTMKIQTVSTERIRRLFDIVPSLLEVMVLMLCFLLSTEVTTVFAFHANRMVGVKYQQSSFTRNDDTIFVTCRKNECKQLKLFATTTTTKLPEDHRVMIPTIGDESGVFEEAKSSRLLNLDGNTYIPLISTSKIDLFDLCNSDVAADSSVVEKSRLLAKFKRQLEKYITSNQHDDVDRAERLLDTMIEINRKYKIDNPQDESVGSNRNGAVVFFDITELTVAHNKVLTYWKKNFKTRPDAAYRIEKLLKKMAKENIANHISYTAYIGMLADQGDPLSAQRAQDIAEYMLASYQPQQQKLTVQNDLKPNSQTWNSVINAWVRCGKVERAEEILKRMENFSSQGHTNMSPNVISYSTVMDGWAKAIFDKDSIAKMENVFHRLIVVHKDGNNNAQPNLFSFVVLIGGYTKKRQQQQQQQQRTNLQKAETIVRRMNEDYGVKPNTQIVTMIVDAWKRSGLHDAGVEAEKILDWLIAIYSDQKDKDLAPNQYTFSSAIDAWAKSRASGKAIHARNVLNKMIQFYEITGLEVAKPNNVCYTAVINACAYSDPLDKRTALKITISTYKALQTSPYEDVRPNSATYVNMLTALRNLLEKSNERDSAVKAVFMDACNNGYMDQLLVQRLKSVMTAKDIQDMLLPNIPNTNTEDLRLDMLPSDWRRNVD